MPEQLFLLKQTVYMGPIGIFDSGYGGLTILKEIKKTLPEYDYMYLGDNARTPYGSRSYEAVYNYTLQAVKYLFDKGCHLIIIACNTASAKALRTIQQNDLPKIAPNKRVLGVIRPSVEEIKNLTETGHIGILATKGTVSSNSYPLEIEKLYRGENLKCVQHACPMWVPIVENNQINTPGADYFLQEDIDAIMRKDSRIDTIILGCTHYPFLYDKIKAMLPKGINVISQGEIVAKSLKDYLKRHPEIESTCLKNSSTKYLTTDTEADFEKTAGYFLGESIEAQKIELH